MGWHSWFTRSVSLLFSLIVPLSLAQVTVPSIRDYLVELDRISSAVKESDRDPAQISRIRNQVPAVWDIQDSGRTFHQSTEWLRQELAEWQTNPSPERQNRILTGLRILREEALSSQHVTTDSGPARSALNSILATAEFQVVREPGLLDRLKQKLMTGLTKLLLRIFSSSAIPTISNMVVYGVIMISVLVVAFWIYKTIQSSGELETLLPFTPLQKKEWTEWLTEAKAAAENGNWREAIHLAYWSGICFLEARGLWRPDRARTPREYVRLLASASEFRSPLVALTRVFELTWYGAQDANADAFAVVVAQLERLGCRLN